MKTNKKENTTMSALQFMREFENTQKIMESIADNTVVQQKALMEAAFAGEDYTDDEGVFDMNSMLDVDVSDKPENQPRYYNSPVDPLSDSDKALIVDEFAKKLATMQNDIIDFSEVGPIATVIQNQFGFKQDVEKFLQDTIQKTSDWMRNQNNTQANTNGVAEQTDGGPADLKPETTSGPEGTEGGIDGMGEMGVEGIPAMTEVPAITDTVADASAIVPPEPAMGDMVPPMGDDQGIEGAEMPPMGGEDMPPMGDDQGIEGVEGGEGEEIPPMGDEAPAIPDETDEATETPAEETAEHATGEEAPDEAPETEKPEAKEEPETDDDDDDEDDKLLESIRSDYKNASVKTQLESVKQTLIDNTPSIDAVKAQLESISSNFHATENAKLEAVKQERYVTARLESIASNFKNAEKAKLEAIEHAKTVDARLQQLLESHQAKSVDGKSNLTARLEAKDKIEKLSK